MPPRLNTKLSLITQNAEQLRLTVETAIEVGDETKVDQLSKLYEAELEKIFSFKSQTQSCAVTKLTFSKDILLIDHPMPHLVEWVFESLTADFERLLAR